MTEICPVAQLDRASDFGSEGWGSCSSGVAILGKQWQMVTSNLGMSDVSFFRKSREFPHHGACEKVQTAPAMAL